MTKNKNILILGASLLQKPAIQSAKELGCKVFVVDGNPNALCVPLADVFEQIDLKDEEKVPLIIGVMKGGIPFMMDLIKYISIPVFLSKQKRVF